MATVVDVAAYILKRCGAMTTMKLQKLAFYSQAESLARRGHPLLTKISKHGVAALYVVNCMRSTGENSLSVKASFL